jgi:hypothetical protein
LMEKKNLVGGLPKFQNKRGDVEGLWMPIAEAN